MVKFTLSKGLPNLLYCGIALGLSVSAYAQRTPSGPLILSTGWYQPGDFPYVIGTLPKENWLGFAYDPLGRATSCKLVPTSISIKHEEVGDQQIETVTYVVAKSGTPKRGQWGYLIHGLSLRSGPFDCVQLERRFSDVAANNHYLSEEPKIIATFRFRHQSGAISLNRLNGQTRLMMQYGGRSQVLLQLGSRSPLVLDAEMIGDLDRDGNPDVIVSEGGGAGEPAVHIKFFLSTKAAAGQLVGEAASY